MTDVKHDEKADPKMPDKMAPEPKAEPVPYSVPIITELRPATAAVNDPDLDLHVIGTGFTSNSMITVNRKNMQTTMNSATDLSTKVKLATDMDVHGGNYVTVKDGTYEAGGVNFTLTPPLTEEEKAAAKQKGAGSSLPFRSKPGENDTDPPTLAKATAEVEHDKTKNAAHQQSRR